MGDDVIADLVMCADIIMSDNVIMGDDVLTSYDIIMRVNEQQGILSLIDIITSSPFVCLSYKK